MKIRDSDITADHLVYYDPQTFVRKRVLPRETACPYCQVSMVIDMEDDIFAHWEKGSYTYTRGQWKLNVECPLCHHDFDLNEYRGFGNQYDKVLTYYKKKLSPYYVWSRTHWEVHNILLVLSSIVWLGFVLPLILVPSMTILIWTAATTLPTGYLVKHSIAPRTHQKIAQPVKGFVNNRLHAGEKYKELSA